MGYYNKGIVGSGVNFALPYMYPDTHMISSQDPAWYHVINYSMTQIYMKSGMKKFGVDAVSNDIKQLHLRNTFEPLDPCTLRK